MQGVYKSDVTGRDQNVDVFLICFGYHFWHPFDPKFESFFVPSCLSYDLIQIFLVIITLLTGVEIKYASLHQFGSIIVLSSYLYIYYKNT